MSRKHLFALAVLAVLTISLVSCGDDEQTPESTPTSASCGTDDLKKGVIADFKVEVLSSEQAKATYVLTKDTEVGVVASRRLLGGEGPRLQFVGRVPFGPQRSTVVNERVFDLPREDGGPLPPGEYQVTLRAFESGRLNQGDPIDTKSACVNLG